MPATEFVRPPWSIPYGVSSVLVEEPTEEPLTLAEAKLRAGLDWAEGDPRDALMAGFIKAARAKVEHDTGLALLTQTRRISINVDAGVTIPIPPQSLPCQSIEEEEGTARGAAFQWMGPGAWHFPAAVTGSWIVVSGWPTAAALAAEAPLLVHACGLLVAHMATLGRDLALTADEPYLMPLGYEDAVQPYRLQWVI